MRLLVILVMQCMGVIPGLVMPIVSLVNNHVNEQSFQEEEALKTPNVFDTNSSWNYTTTFLR